MNGFVYSLFAHLAVFAALLMSSVVESQQSNLVQVQIVSSEPKPVAPPPQKNVRAASRPPEETLKPAEAAARAPVAEPNPMVNLQQSGASSNEVYGYLVNLIYKNRIYPYESIRLKQQGQVTLSFYIDENGDLKDISLIKPSDYRQLNHAAVNTLKTLKLNRSIPQIESLYKRQYSFTFDFELVKSL